MNKLIDYSLGVFFVTSFVFLQAFSLYRLPLLVIIFISCFLYSVRFRLRFNVYVLFYYFIMASLTLIWCFIGLYYSNSNLAVQESFFVYAVYPLIYAPIVIYMSNKNYKLGIDKVVFFASSVIFLFAVYTVLNALYQLNILPEVFHEQMLLDVGLHEGYTQLNNVNIGALCFILPYGVCRCLIERKISMINVFTVIFSLAAALIASRRIIIFIFIIAPLISFLIYALVTKLLKFEIIFKLIRFYSYLLIIFSVAAGYIYYNDKNTFYGFYDRISEVFDENSHGIRTLQNEALLNSLEERPILGSGYGGTTRVVRSVERPWTFESTYHRIAFNSGVIGVLFLFFFFMIYNIFAIYSIRMLSDPFVQIALLVGFISVVIASATNPYMSSFDYIFVLSIVPLIINSVNSSLKGEY